ncbi:hypothetical protein [Streptomyces sp. NPDC012825]|uniref:hypothetical protein n=1 Tax=Streptomyces sp. NPDC012825 TaxID=3364851 RepID=UPI0036BA6EA8
MSTLDDIASAMNELREAEAVVDAKRAALYAKISAARQDEAIKQADIGRVTGYSRETLRKIARAAEAEG